MRTLFPRLFIFIALLFIAALTQPRSAEAQPRATTRSMGAPAVSSAALLAPGAPAADDARMQEPEKGTELRQNLRFTGFIEPQLRLVNKDEIADRGFTLNDAALYFSKDFGRGVTALIDLPFMSADSATTNNIGFGATKAQAYFQFERSSITTKFGQFDTTFGVELNDSRDRALADAGFIKSYILPTTHTGLLLGFGVQDFLIRAIVADPQNSNSMTSQNPEFGIQMRYENPTFYGSAGLLAGESKAAANSKTTMLLDVMAGMRLDRFRLDLSFDNKKSAGQDKSGNSFGLFAGFDVIQDLAVAARFEYLKDPIVPSAVGPVLADQAMLFALGPDYKLANDISLRADMTAGQIRVPNTSDTNLFGVSISVLASL